MSPVIIFFLLVVMVFPAQNTDSGLRVWVRDLADRGVAGVQLQIVDADELRRDVLTDAQGVALITPLPDRFVRIVGATTPDGQTLLMDENDPSGGLRIPMEPGEVQPLDLRLSDGLLFVEPVAEPETPPSPLPTTTVTSAVPVASAARDTGAAVSTPEAVARTSYRWVRWLVVAVAIGIAAVVIISQVGAILRARRAA